MKEENTFYPKLTEKGKKEAQYLIDEFKGQFKKIADEIIGYMYVDLSSYIESDSWSNFRNQVISGFKNYDNKIQESYDFKQIRAEIFKDFKDEIIKDLNQDLLEENRLLKKRIENLQKIYEN